MTSSETPTEPPARAPWNRDRWLRIGVIAGAIVIGWVFIAATHKFRLGPAVVFLGLGWVAVVAGVHNLWRTGTATTDPVDEAAAWWRPTGARDELEREKRSLLKAIKEVEFDLQTGKMSTKDAGEITRVYRARAIEVIKAIDELDARGGQTLREQIEHEVRVRAKLESPKPPPANAKSAKPTEPKPATASKPEPAAAKPAETETETETATGAQPAVATETEPAAATASEAS